MDKLSILTLATVTVLILAPLLKFETTLTALALAPQQFATTEEPSPIPQLVLAIALLLLALSLIKSETLLAIVFATFNALPLRLEAPIPTFVDVFAIMFALLDSLSTLPTAIVTAPRLVSTPTSIRLLALVDLALETGLRMEMDNALFALLLLHALDQEFWTPRLANATVTLTATSRMEMYSMLTLPALAESA